MLATLLIVTVFNVGGPPLLTNDPGGRAGTRVMPAQGVTVLVRDTTGHGTKLKTDRHGRAYLRVAQGRYAIQAACGFYSTGLTKKAPRVRVRGRVTRVRRFCGIR
jgi:hypothetical protein